MTPQMPLCGGEFSHLPSTSEESEGSIVGNEEQFLEGRGVRGEVWGLFLLFFTVVTICPAAGRC